MLFRLDRAAPVVNDSRRLRGALTIRAVRRPVELLAAAEEIGNDTLRIHLEGKIRRSDFGLDWGALRQAGRLLLADQVRLTADVVLVRESCP